MQPTLELLEIRKSQNPKHRHMQRQCITQILKACVDITKFNDNESILKLLRASLNHLIKGKKNTDSLIEQYNLFEIITADMSAKLMPMYAILSLYDLELKIQGGIHLLPGGGLLEVPLEIKSRELFQELSQRILDTDTLTTLDITRLKSEYSNNFKFWSNAIHITRLEKEFIWWRDKSTVGALLTKDRVTHWMRFLQCNSYLGFTSKQISKLSPHPFLPTKLGQINEPLVDKMAAEMTNQLSENRRSLSIEGTYYRSLRRTLIWLNSGLDYDKSKQFNINGTDNFSTRGFMISVFSDYHNERHYLDWYLLYILSISKKPYSDALDYPYIPFRLILNQLGKAFSQDQIIGHPLVGKINLDDEGKVRETTLSIQESISLLRLARDTLPADESGAHVSTFIAMLENPHFQLGERFGGREIYSEMERWNITPDSAFFSGPLPTSTVPSMSKTASGVEFTFHASINDGGELRRLYVQQMLNEFIGYLINVSLQFLREQE